MGAFHSLQVGPCFHSALRSEFIGGRTILEREATGNPQPQTSFCTSLRLKLLLNFGHTQAPKHPLASVMNVNLGIWDKLSKLMVLLLFLVGLVAVFFWYLPLIQQNQRYRKQLLTLEAKHMEEERLGRQLRSAIDSVQNDPKTIERLAREKLGWGKTNEMVIRFESSTGPRR
jgi:cell division protein FtsB